VSTKKKWNIEKIGLWSRIIMGNNNPKIQENQKSKKMELTSSQGWGKSK
jgi:hypothetical protein